MQIVRNHCWKVTVVEHFGSAHNEAELTALLTAGKAKFVDYGTAEQLEPGPPTDIAAPPLARTVAGSRLPVPIGTITQSRKRLCSGDAINDSAFCHLVMARPAEPRD